MRADRSGRLWHSQYIQFSTIIFHDKDINEYGTIVLKSQRWKHQTGVTSASLFRNAGFPGHNKRRKKTDSRVSGIRHMERRHCASDRFEI